MGLETFLKIFSIEQHSLPKPSNSWRHPSLRWKTLSSTAGLSLLLLACGPVPVQGSSPTLIEENPISIATPVVQPDSIPPILDVCNTSALTPIVDEENPNSRFQLYLDQGINNPASGVLSYTIRGGTGSERRENILFFGSHSFAVIATFNNLPTTALQIDGVFMVNGVPRLSWASDAAPLNFRQDNTYFFCWENWEIQRTTLNDQPLQLLPLGQPILPPSGKILKYLIP